MLLLITAVFALAKLIPGDEARAAAGPNASLEEVRAASQRLGLDHSALSQFWLYLGRLAHGDLGTSTFSNTSISSGVLDALPGTIELVLLATFMMLFVGIPAATVSAFRSGGPFDRGMSTAVVFVAGLPVFALGLMLQYWVGSQLRLLPVSGNLSSSYAVPVRTRFVLIDTLIAGSPAAFLDALAHLALPASILAASFGAQFYRALRAELLQVLTRDFVMVARAAGVEGSRLSVRYVLPNAAGPALTVLGVLFGAMIGGALLVESVFGLPGIGSYVINAVSNKDVFAVLGGVLAIGVFVVLVNLLVDILQLVRDPRLLSAELKA